MKTHNIYSKSYICLVVIEQFIICDLKNETFNLLNKNVCLILLGRQVCECVWRLVRSVGQLSGRTNKNKDNNSTA